MRFVERFILLMGAVLVLNLNAVASEKLENTKTNETTVASLGLYYYPNFPKMHTVSGHANGYRGLGKCQGDCNTCLLYTSPSPRDRTRSRMPSSA